LPRVSSTRIILPIRDGSHARFLTSRSGRPGAHFGLGLGLSSIRCRKKDSVAECSLGSGSDCPEPHSHCCGNHDVRFIMNWMSMASISGGVNGPSRRCGVPARQLRSWDSSIQILVPSSARKQPLPGSDASDGNGTVLGPQVAQKPCRYGYPCSVFRPELWSASSMEGESFPGTTGAEKAETGLARGEE